MEFPGGQTQQRNVRNFKGRFQAIQGDEYSGAQAQIDIQHLMVHAGRYFSASDVDLLVAIASPKEWLFRMPDLEDYEIHCQFAISSSAQCVVELFENPTVSADGSEITPVNHHRTSTYASRVEVYSDPTVTDDGDRLNVAGIGSTGGSVKIGGVARNNAEWDLIPGTLYLIRVTVAANDSVVSQNAEWYEFYETEMTWEDPASSSSS